MKVKKAMLSLGISAVLIMGLAGCGADTSESVKEAKGTASTETGMETAVTEETADVAMSKYDETIDLHFVRSTDETVDKVLEARPGETLEDNFWLDTYRDELGINVIYDWIVKGGDEYTQKVNVTIANGELPDVMYVNKTQVQQMQ